MSVPIDPKRIRRIAVTIDAFGLSTQALEQAVRLAKLMNAQLEGIFIEDIDLLQVAELPFLREVRTVSRSEDAINLVRIEQEFRALARRAERMLSQQAEQNDVSWSFRIWRGSIDADVLAADVEADVFALTRLGAALSRSRAIATPSTTVSVLFSGSEASRRALETAVSLAADPPKQLSVVIPADDDESMRRLQLAASHQLGEARHADFIRLHDGSLADLLEILRDSHSAVLVVERESAFLQTPVLRQHLNSLDCLLMIVR